MLYAVKSYSECTEKLNCQIEQSFTLTTLYYITANYDYRNQSRLCRQF